MSSSVRSAAPTVRWSKIFFAISRCRSETVELAEQVCAKVRYSGGKEPPDQLGGESALVDDLHGGVDDVHRASRSQVEGADRAP